jgi:glyoxylase-like metal-dependent hydrolase (beta-lactamase superfamily II)
MHADTVDLGNDVFMMDTRMGGYEAITSSYLIRSSRPCLVETGAARSAPVVIEQLQRLGIGPDDLGTIVVTHIHLDHAGGVGDLAQAFPHAQIVVQEKGARHLADPSRLVASAHRVFGEAMDRLFGDLRPTEAARIVSIAQRGSVDLGDGRSLAAFHNPGHASHHIGLVDSATGDLYTGDAAGVYVPETADVRPATPPPDFDLDLTLSSLQAMRDVAADTVAVQPFRAGDGYRRDPRCLGRRIARVGGRGAPRAGGLPRHGPCRGDGAREGSCTPSRLYDDPELLAKQEELSGTQANVAGIMRWLDLQDKDA